MEQNKDQGNAAVRGEAVAECALPPAGWYCTRTAGHDGPCAAYPVNSTAAEHEAAILEVIDQRDKYHDMADQLAAQIAAMTEVEIGEHSSANEPWRNALIAGDEFIAAKFKAFCNGPVSARAADALDSQPTGDGKLLCAMEFEAVELGYAGLAEAMAALRRMKADPDADREALIACLGDDATTLSHINPGDEMAQTMREAIAMLESDEVIIATLGMASSQPTDGAVRNG